MRSMTSSRLFTFAFMTSAFAWATGAFALDASGLKAQLEANLDLPFSMALIGPLDEAKVEVTGAGPFQVSVSGGTISDSEVPDLSFTVAPLGGDLYRVSNVAFEDDLKVAFGSAVIDIDGLTWSGVWDNKARDYGEFSFAFDSLKAGGEDMPFKADMGAISMQVSAWDPATGETRIQRSLAPSRFEMDMGDFASIIDDPSPFSEELPESRINYSLGQIVSDTTIKGTGRLSNFEFPRFMLGLAKDNPTDEPEAMMFAAKQAIDLIFQPVDSFANTTSIASISSSQDDELMSISSSTGLYEIDAQYGDDASGAAKTLMWKTNVQDYMIDGVIKEDLGFDFQVALKEGGSETLVDRFEPEQLRGALEALVDQVEDEVKVETVEEILTSFGGIDSKQQGTSLSVESQMMGRFLTAESVDGRFQMNMVEGDDRISGYEITLSGLKVPAAQMVELPERAIPTTLGLNVGLTQEALTQYISLLGRDNLNAIISQEASPIMLAMENLPAYIQGFDEGNFDPSLGLHLAGEGYDFRIQAEMEVGATLGEEGPQPTVKGLITMAGVEGFKNHILGLSPDLPEQYQALVFPIIGGVGMMESMARTGENGDLLFDVELVEGDSLSVNGNVFPIPGL